MSALLLIVASWTAAAGGTADGAAAAEGTVDYLRDVKPILASRCYACHGALKQESAFRLDTAASLKRGGELGDVVVAGHAEESLIIEAVTGDVDVWRMPPKGDPLTPEQIDLLRRWIDQGAAEPAEEQPESDPRDHWAFRPIVRPPIPAAFSAPNGATPEEATPGGNPIDAFLAAAQRSAGLSPVGPAPKHVLLRRVYLDLVGLPPTPEELEAFLADGSPDAYERVVDRLLASPQYGERWARHWMDVWRYSDWYGRRERDELRNSQRHIWQWRDWIVESLNEDKGYDRMVVEMLAGDEIAPADLKTLRATGFLARNYNRTRELWLEDTVEHTAMAFLGLTVRCARCHDHKYDPITQQDYYQMRAIFEPHQVRTDRLPGEPDVTKMGLPRVFDRDLTAPTYLFVGGNIQKPDKSIAIVPDAPRFLRDAPLDVEPVQLPAVAYYPALRPAIQKEELVRQVQAVEGATAQLAERSQALKAAEARLAAANELERKARPTQGQAPTAKSANAAKETKALPPKPAKPNEEVRKEEDPKVATPKAGNPKPDQRSERHPTTEEPKPREAKPAVEDVKRVAEVATRRAELRLAEKRLAMARSELAAVRARIAADTARFGRGATAQQSERFAAAALKAERRAACCRAECALVQAEQGLAAVERTMSPEDPKRETAMAAARKKMSAARTAFEKARAAEQAPEGTYTSFGEEYPATSTGRRRAFAEWVVADDNPLPARVAVNHIWMRHFGEPLVPTVSDFGRNGKPPTHPELLDWLARELIDSGWSMKHLHRLIVTSAAYRRDSSVPAADAPQVALDPENRNLWRMNSRRLEAEAVRDSLLYVSGQLDLTRGGPDIPPEESMTQLRRSLYFRHAGDGGMEFLEVFDAANPVECYRRSERIVPHQALAMINSELSFEAARHVASRVASQLAERGQEADDAAFIRTAWTTLLARPASGEELAACEAYLVRQTEKESANEREHTAGQASRAKPETLQARARESLVHVLINHTDFVTIR